MGTICVPQIIAALLGGTILSFVGSNQSNMMIFAGGCLIVEHSVSLQSG